jgi:asparagine synthase (glutamine-hydrolysing)
MCGIAGVLSPTPLTEEVKAILRRMNGEMQHRGPDDDGYYFDEHVALAMRRLSIIDVAGGHQPLRGESGNTAVVCNGEIYNFVELRRELEARGHRFHSRSDVETILPLYEEVGADCAKRLRGMYAFALWDKGRRKLLLARDRFGEKPLYLRRDAAGRLWFASEMKALLTTFNGERPTLSREGASLFLTYQYIPEPRTMFEGITKLEAGHCLAVTPDELKVGAAPRSVPYWNYLDAPARTGDPKVLVREALEDASRITLRSDVPVGIALSGGIDSSLVAVLSRKFHKGELKAFSVGYSGRPENDERASAETLARRLDMPFHDVELSVSQLVSNFPQLVHDMDDPVGDIAAYGYHAVSRLAREHGVPVLLSGMGADELFWGYEWVRQAVGETIDKQKKLAGLLGRWFTSHPKRAIFFDKLDWVRNSVPVIERLTATAGSAAVPSDLWTRYFESDVWGDVPLWLMDVHNKTWLTSNCLALTDRVSMAHSVELRLPFLDFELVDLATGLRKAGLVDWNKPHKWLLIEAIRDLLPPEVLARQKRGFTPPVADWMDAVVRAYKRLLAGGSLVRHGVFVPDVLDRLPNRHPVGLSYRMILLELWSRIFVDGEEPRSLLPAR